MSLLNTAKTSVRLVGLIFLISLLSGPAFAADCNSNGQDDSVEFDVDGDGVIDACDNCLSVQNSSQLDSNNDGYGNMCDADLDDNGSVSFLDYGMLTNAFLSTDADADLNGDGVVNFIDISIFKSLFLQPPGPGLPESDVTPDADAMDADGNIYHTIRIGDQIWMLENLKTTRFNDGAPITEWTFGTGWNEGGGTVPFYQWASTDDLNNFYDFELPFDFYGAQYNEAAIASGNLAPVGWRIPTGQDFEELESFISNDGQLGEEATALMSTVDWPTGGTDVYGFNALPNGYVTNFGTSTGVQVISTWTTSDDTPANQTRKIVNLFDSEGSFLYFDQSILLGAGIRCIKE